MRRIEIAVLLSAKFTYDQISEMLGVGSEKISRVHKCLQHDDSGYSIIVKRLIENRKERLRKIKKEERDASSVLDIVNKKYKGYFLLNNLLDSAIEKLQENNKELEEEALFFTPSLSHRRKIRK